MPPGREALLDALIIDGWDSLAKALRARYEQTRPRPAHQRWIAVTRAHRAWALEHPSEYLLLYGHTGLRVTPGADPRGPAGHVEGRCRAVHDDARRPRLRGDRHRKAPDSDASTPSPAARRLARNHRGDSRPPRWRPSRLPDRIRPAPRRHHPGANRADPPSAPAHRPVRPADGPRLRFPERAATSLVTQQATSPARLDVTEQVVVEQVIHHALHPCGCPQPATAAARPRRGDSREGGRMAHRTPFPLVRRHRTRSGAGKPVTEL